jgi:hypothetical protein
MLDPHSPQGQPSRLRLPSTSAVPPPVLLSLWLQQPLAGPLHPHLQQKDVLSASRVDPECLAWSAI